jgi:hypothetical protein
MKKLSIIVPALASLLFSSCLKDKANVDLSNLSYIAEISTASTNSTPNAPSSGLDFFTGATLSAAATDPDTVTFTVNIASPYPPTKDVPVTLAVNDAARVTYISDPSKVQYLAFPANSFKLVSTTGTVKAGTRLATFTVVFTHAALDATLSYMLPITITAAPGTTISGNLSTIYFHIVGNPIAGNYKVTTGFRRNYTGTGGGPFTDTDLTGLIKFAAPENTTVVDINYANLGPADYYIVTYDPVAKTIKVTANSAFTSSVTNFAIDVATYDPITKTIHLVSHYTNATPADRVIDETLVHQ